MDERFIEIAQRGFYKKPGGIFKTPDIFVKGDNIYIRLLVGDSGAGIQLGDGVSQPWLRGLREFQYLLSKSFGFSVTFLSGKQSQDLSLAIEGISGTPNLTEIVYPKSFNPKDYDYDHRDLNLQENLRFSQLNSKTSEFFQKFGFQFPNSYYGETRDEDIIVEKILPIVGNYSLSFRDKDFEDFKEILGLSDTFAITSEHGGNFYKLVMMFEVYNLRF